MKVVLFTEEFDAVIEEYNTLDEIFGLYHERVWGLTKNECIWDTEREGCFITGIYKPTVKVKNHLIKSGIPKSFFEYNTNGGRVTSSNRCIAFMVLMDKFKIEDLNDAIDDYLTESENELVTDKIRNYVMTEYRDKKLNDLGI